jgi:hypothetical protein
LNYLKIYEWLPGFYSISHDCQLLLHVVKDSEFSREFGVERERAESREQESVYLFFCVILDGLDDERSQRGCPVICREQRVVFQ